MYRLYTPSIISRDENKQVEEANVYPGWLIYREPPGRTNATSIVLETMRELNPEINMGMFPLPISDSEEDLLFP